MEIKEKIFTGVSMLLLVLSFILFIVFSVFKCGLSSDVINGNVFTVVWVVYLVSLIAYLLLVCYELSGKKVPTFIGSLALIMTGCLINRLINDVIVENRGVNLLSNYSVLSIIILVCLVISIILCKEKKWSYITCIAIFCLYMYQVINRGITIQQVINNCTDSKLISSYKIYLNINYSLVIMYFGLAVYYSGLLIHKKFKN